MHGILRLITKIEQIENNKISGLFNLLFFYIYIVLITLNKHSYLFLGLFFSICLINSDIELNVNALLNILQTEDKHVKYLTTILLFFIGSTMTLYVFFFKEKKDIIKSSVSNSWYNRLFILTTLSNYFTLFMILFSPNFDLKLFVLFLSTSIYLLFLLINLFSINQFNILLFRISITKMYIKSYNYMLSGKLNRKILCLATLNVIVFSFLYVTLFVITTLYYNSIHINDFIKVLVPLITYIMFFNLELIMILEDSKQYINNLKNNLLDTLNFMIFHNELDDGKINEIKEFFIPLNDSISILLKGAQTDKYLAINHFLQNPDTIEEMIILYESFLERMSDSMINNENSGFAYKLFSKEVINYTPIIFCNSQKNKENYEYLNRKYKSVYILVISKILVSSNLKTFTNEYKFLNMYRENIKENLSLSMFGEPEQFKNLEELYINIELMTLSKFVLKDNLEGVIKICLPIMEKRFQFENKNDDYVKYLLIALIKSLELSHLSIGGYLMKIITSNFKAQRIAQGLKEIKKDFSENSKDKKDFQVFLNDFDGDAIFLIHYHSMEYCFSKSFMLLKYYNNNSELFSDIVIEQKYIDDIISRIEMDNQKLGLTTKVIEKMKEDNYLKTKVFFPGMFKKILCLKQ